MQRLVHASGDFEIVDDIFISPGAVEAGVKALSQCTRIVSDVTMVLSGLRRTLLQELSVKTVCCVHDEETKLLAEADGLTRSAAGIRRAWMQFGNDLILAIGDAPTAVEEAVRLVNEQQWRPHLDHRPASRIRRDARVQGKSAALPANPAHHESRHARRIAMGCGCRERDAHSRGKQIGKEMTPQETFPDSTTRSRFDLGQMAANGLKRGYTTGSCATAAVKAALLKLVCNESPTEVECYPAGRRAVSHGSDRLHSR